MIFIWKLDEDPEDIVLQRPSLNIIDGSMLVQGMDTALAKARRHNRTDVISMLEKVKLGEDDNKQEGIGSEDRSHIRVNLKPR